MKIINNPERPRQCLTCTEYFKIRRDIGAGQEGEEFFCRMNQSLFSRRPCRFENTEDQDWDETIDGQNPLLLGC